MLNFSPTLTLNDEMLEIVLKLTVVCLSRSAMQSVRVSMLNIGMLTVLATK